MEAKPAEPGVVMQDFFQWLSASSVATGVLVASFGALVLTVMALYLMAFRQGRSVSFWPPKIGPKPSSSANTERDTGITSVGPPQPGTDLTEGEGKGPIIRKGTVLQSASGMRLTVESPFYGGAMSTLFKATSSGGGVVIVKVYWRDLGEGSEAAEFFKRDVRVAETLKHRNIVKLLDRGLYGRYPFTVLEFMAGGTLRDLLRSRDHVPGADILSIAKQVAKALDYAHAKGVVHRDVKPGNILFEGGPADRVALGDFGMARILAEEAKRITAVGALIGTPMYMAPELIQARPVSPATDVYSFTLVLFEMIAGRNPYDRFPEPWSLIQDKIQGDPPDLMKYRSSVPHELAARLSQALSADPSKRPQKASLVLDGIEKELTQL
jgi:serine/threonine-protein kinase